MTKAEAIAKLANHGIYQLNRGESLDDALASVDSGGSRKGYKVLADNGRRLSENEIIANENSVAFHKSFTPTEFHEDHVEEIDDICDSEDFREDKTARGVIIHCYYCGTCLRVDSNGLDDDEDYPEPIDTIHCDGCMNDAISRLAM
jgi:hypothetical protein